MTDALASYKTLEEAFIHGVIDHAEAYVDGNIHTNGIENFWSLLKRAIKGTYVSVEPFHLFRYIDEEAFRFNTRKAHRRLTVRESARSGRGQAIGLQDPDRQNVRLRRGRLLNGRCEGRALPGRTRIGV